MSRKSHRLCSVLRWESRSNARIQSQFKCPSHLNTLLSSSRGHVPVPEAWGPARYSRSASCPCKGSLICACGTIRSERVHLWFKDCTLLYLFLSVQETVLKDTIWQLSVKGWHSYPFWKGCLTRQRPEAAQVLPISLHSSLAHPLTRLLTPRKASLRI